MKLTKILFIISGLMILLYISGISNGGFIETTLHLISNPSGLASNSTGSLYNTIYLIIAGLTVGGIFISIATRQSPEIYLIGGLVLLLLAFVGDIVLTISYMTDVCPIGGDCSWMTYLVMMIMIPLGIIFLLSIIEWWRGTN